MNQEKSYVPGDYAQKNISYPCNPPAYSPQNEKQASQIPVAPSAPNVPPAVQVMYAQAQPARVVNPVGPTPTSITCPSCNAKILSRVEYQASTKTHLIALLTCLLGCWLCCCIPYCVDSCQNANHYCPNCEAYLGTFKN